jgi:poly[(R)-3-hydroxyalkanoate] polymerase subunit PhaC
MVGESFQQDENGGGSGLSSSASTSAERDLLIDDPPATTPFDVVDEGGLLRLRHYRGEDRSQPTPPVLLVYSLLKRPYILDLLPDRSMVRSFLRQGFSVYLTDWLPPLPEDAECGLHTYVNRDLARAVECVRRREQVERISLVGCCLGGLLSAIYTALYPQNVQHLVPFALPFQSRPPLAPGAAEYLARVYGNVPAWWISATMNARVSNPYHLPTYLAEELGEAELAESVSGEEPQVQRMLERWFRSDVPLAGRLFCDVVQDIHGDEQFAQGRLRVGNRRVALENIRCPVLNISAERDRLVPPQESASFIEHVGAVDASNLIFPSGHLGLMVSRAAHDKLWPHVAGWLRARSGLPRVRREIAAESGARRHKDASRPESTEARA